MDADKRKRDGEGGREGKRAKVAEKDRETVTEEEVEMFFAILGRIQVAAKHFGKTVDRAGGNKLRASMKFELQDFAEDNNGSLTNEKIDEAREVKVDSGLDLNSSPVSEGS